MEDRPLTSPRLPEGEISVRFVSPRTEDVVTAVEPASQEAITGPIPEAPDAADELTRAFTDENGKDILVEIDPFGQADESGKEADGPTKPTVYEALNEAVAPLVELAFFGEGEDSKKAFGQIYATLAPTLLRHRILHGLPDDVQEDLVQDTFVRALRARENGSINRVDNVAGWFAIILTNLTKDRYRKTKRTPVDLVDMTEHSGPLAGIESSCNTEEDLIAIDSLAKLYTELRTRATEGRRKGQDVTTDWVDILHSIDVEGMSYKEYAEREGIGTGTASSRLFRARDKMRAILAEQGITRAQ